jgi:hypothetical protein
MVTTAISGGKTMLEAKKAKLHEYHYRISKDPI